MHNSFKVASLASQKYFVHVPDGWERALADEWSSYLPPQGIQDHQGWKIHISSTLKESHEVLQLVADISIKNFIPFKHLSTEERFFWRNSKICAREHAGKFITLYPSIYKIDKVLYELEEALHPFDGPYVLSDRRWKKAPVFLRFGVFSPILKNGKVSTSFIDPDGNEVPDERSVKFIVPEWAPKTLEISRWLENYTKEIFDIPFNIQSAIKFSNSGGVYKGQYKGKSSLIKEGRLYAGLDPMLHDSVERLEMESYALSCLKGVRGVPETYAKLKVWEHVFLIQSFASGVSLHAWLKDQKIFTRESANKNFQKYLESSLEILKSIYKIISDIHARGWSHMDIHPANILVNPENFNVTLIDFENAQSCSDKEKKLQVMAAPGFGLEGAHRAQLFDIYGLRQIGLFLLFPSVAENKLDPNHAYTIIRRLRERGAYLQLPTGSGKLDEYLSFLEYLSHEISSYSSMSMDSKRGDLCTVDSIINEIEKQAQERCVREAKVGGNKDFLGVACPGSSNNLVFPLHDYKHAPTEGLFSAAIQPCGSSEEVVDKLQKIKLEISNSEYQGSWRVYDGLAGTLIGLSHSYSESKPAQKLIEKLILSIAYMYIKSPDKFAPLGLTRNTLSNDSESQDSGLFYGHLGYAWLFSIKLNHPIIIHACTRALENELSSYVMDSGSTTLQLSQGKRLLPYLSTGSAGFGVLLPNIPRETWPAGLQEKLPLLYNACDPIGSAFAGLFNGYAGLQLGRAGLAHLLGAKDAYNQSICNLVESFDFYAVRTKEANLSMVGEGSSSHSISIAEGMGGVLLALQTLKSNDSNFFKYLTFCGGFKDD